MPNFVTIGSILFYVLTFILLLRNANQIKEQSKENSRSSNRPVVLILWVLACVLHAVYLYPHTFTNLGVNLTFYNSVSIILLIISSFALILSAIKQKDYLGLFIIPISIAAIFLTIIKPVVSSSAPNLHGMQFHIASSLFAFSVLAIAAIQSIVLFRQDRQLRDLSSGGLSSTLPSLQDSEKFLFQTITVGFLLLTISLISGFVFLDNMFQQHVAHKTVLSIIAWIVFAVLLWGRWQFGWRGRAAIRWTVGGFALLILAYLGSKFVQELILHRIDTIPIS